MAAPSYLLTNYTGTTDPAGDIITLIETQLTAAGWIFVEQYAFTQFPTSRLMRIWKNPSTLNAAAVDFYIAFVKNAVAGTYLAMRAFEGWDTSGKTIQRPCIQGSATQVPVAVTYTGGAGDWLPTGVTTPLMVDTVPTTTLAINTNYDVGVLASKSYVVIGCNLNISPGTTQVFSWVIGMYLPIYTDSQASFPPLVALDLRAGLASANSGVSRSLRVTSGTNAFEASVGPESLMLGTFVSGVKEPVSQTIRSSRVAIATNQQTNGFSASGGYRGWLYDAAAVAITTNTSTKIGDTVAFGATTYTCLGQSVSPANFMVAGSAAFLFNTGGGS